MEVFVSKEFVEDLKERWESLWQERIDDKVRAEGIANKDYSMLFVERGTVIFATRNFKPLSFREILELHKVAGVDRIVSPDPQVGGWGKFIRTEIVRKHSIRRRRVRPDLGSEKKRQHLKKGGNGWLHFECNLIRPRSR